MYCYLLLRSCSCSQIHWCCRDVFTRRNFKEKNTYIHAWQKCPFFASFVAWFLILPGVNIACRSCVRRSWPRWECFLVGCHSMWVCDDRRKVWACTMHSCCMYSRIFSYSTNGSLGSLRSSHPPPSPSLSEPLWSSFFLRLTVRFSSLGESNHSISLASLRVPSGFRAGASEVGIVSEELCWCWCRDSIKICLGVSRTNWISKTAKILVAANCMM